MAKHKRDKYLPAKPDATADRPSLDDIAEAFENASDVSERVREAARAGRIEYASADRVDRLDDIAARVMPLLVGADRGYLITDLSRVSDFAPHPRVVIWESRIEKEMEAAFGVPCDSDDLLCELFERIERKEHPERFGH